MSVGASGYTAPSPGNSARKARLLEICRSNASVTVGTVARAYETAP